MANAVYWVGSNGNIYLKAPETDTSGRWTVTDMGAASRYGGLAGVGGVDSAVYPDATRIADPSAVTASAAPTGGSTAPVKTLNTGAVQNTQIAIDQLPALLQAALQAEGQRYGNTVNEFNAQEGTQRKTYEGSTTTNQQNYDANFMDSIRSGIKGLGGLMALLRGTGASGGSVDDTVRDTVGGVTSNDIREGADTRDENQGTLDASLSEFLTALGTKRRVNEDTRVNNERAIRRDTNTQLQDLYGKMAGFYGDADRVAERDSWMSRAGALTPEIAANSRTQVSPYDTTPVAVQAPQLTAFAGPTQPNVLAAPADGQVGSGIFTMSDRRRKDQTLAPALAGA